MMYDDEANKRHWTMVSEEQDPREAHYYWTLREFEQLLYDNTTERILNDIDFEAYRRIRDWFVNKQERKDVGVLLDASQCRREGS